MAFPSSFLEELRARVDLSVLIGRQVRLIRKGRGEFLGLCPFHNEKTPSFHVYADHFHCFGCGAHGDALGFVMRAERLEFVDAVERLAGEAGLEVPRQNPEERERENRRARLTQVLEAACAFYEESLRSPGGREALDYLRRRGLSAETITAFRLGYAPRSGLLAALKGVGADESLLREAGLRREGENGRSAYDFFRDRVMFPITDRVGRVIAFGARALGDAQPKYLNSPDTPVFNKGRVLYGIAHARRAQAAELIVVEGYMDALALNQAGLGPAVAPLGTALTAEQLAECWKLAPEPVLCFDGDRAGRAAAAKATELALPLAGPGRSARVALLPPGKDPDDVLRDQGKDAMAALLAGAEPLVAHVWRLLSEGRSVDTPERRAALEQDVEEWCGRIAEPATRRGYREDLRERFRVLTGRDRPASAPGRHPYRPFTARRSRQGDWRQPEPVAVPMADYDSPGDAWRSEAVLLATAINHPDIISDNFEHLGGWRFADGRLDALRESLLRMLADDPELDRSEICRHLTETGFRAEVDRVLDRRLYQLYPFAGPEAALDMARRGFQEFGRAFARQSLKEEISRLNQEWLASGNDAMGERLAALREQLRRLEEGEP